MKIEVQIKEDNKVTTYTADTKKAEELIKHAKVAVDGFLKDTFKKTTYVKQEDSNEGKS